ncbi:MAG TPA: 30S ribosome-binding factor RbfA [Phycisphaerae bacterium]|nr:30S ribosome-binding factor RbfA [Phycisphaerae bacterium]
MSHRIARVAHIVRDVVSDAIANRVSDPRVHHFTSVTRVEITADLRYADVHVSVMGTDAESQTTMTGLASARGMIQTRLAKQLDIRQCPILRFHLDRGIKIGIETIRMIDAAAAESRQRTGDSPESKLDGASEDQTAAETEEGRDSQSQTGAGQ